MWHLQVLALAMLYNQGLTVGNYQYFLQDLFHTTLLAAAMAFTGAATELSRERPLATVLSVGVILPVIGQVGGGTVIVVMFVGLVMAVTMIFHTRVSVHTQVHAYIYSQPLCLTAP